MFKRTLFAAITIWFVACCFVGAMAHAGPLPKGSGATELARMMAPRCVQVTCHVPTSTAVDPKTGKTAFFPIGGVVVVTNLGANLANFCFTPTVEGKLGASGTATARNTYTDSSAAGSVSGQCLGATLISGATRDVFLDPGMFDEGAAGARADLCDGIVKSPTELSNIRPMCRRGTTQCSKFGTSISTNCTADAANDLIRKSGLAFQCTGTSSTTDVELCSER